MKIGIDFDNTIANYDFAFLQVANLLGFSVLSTTKRQLKLELRNDTGDESDWQKIQGLVYGKYIEFATPFAGVGHFVQRAHSLGHELFIVSHKTRLGHFDSEMVDLRASAHDWLKTNALVGRSNLQIPWKNVYFCDTREEKVSRIAELGLDFFVDDLIEVLEDSRFPSSTCQILFDTSGDRSSSTTTCSTWRQISEEILGEISEAEILGSVCEILPSLGSLSISSVEGRGNSKIMKLGTASGDLALKIYPDDVSDFRNRRQTEWDALVFLSKDNLPVTTPIATSAALNWSIFDWIDGERADSSSLHQMMMCVDFVRTLAHNYNHANVVEDFGFASEACISPSDVETQIRNRLEQFAQNKDLELESFFRQSLRPAFISQLVRAKVLLGSAFGRQLEEERWVLSPSDFGLHNAILTPSKGIRFIDFEYFGWDDPVKLTIDVCLHPGMNLNLDLQRIWVYEMEKLFSNDQDFRVRMVALWPLFVVRWTLILLNEFRPDKLRNRIHASSRLRDNVRDLQIHQLEKARVMMEKLEIVDSWW